MPFRILIVLISLLAAVGTASARTNPAIVSRPDFERYFQDSNVRGTLVLMKEGSGRMLAYDPGRAGTSYLPASTFKILNACIALETGVAAGPDALFPWDGVTRPIEGWNRDLALREAFVASSVPVFQEIARQIRKERMAYYVKKARYGNADIGGGIDRFWLEGDLRISALEQVDFLRRLYRGELPFSPRTMDAVKDMMVQERGEDWVIRGKSGWASRVTPNIGWWVGWLERGGEVWFIALNIDMQGPDQLKARKDVVLAALKGEGLLP